MCTHVCQCGGGSQSSTATSQPPLQSLPQQHHISANHNNGIGEGEWIWSTRQGFAAPGATTILRLNNGFPYAETATNTSFASSSALQLENLHQAPSAIYKTLDNNDSLVSAWLPQNETLDGLWGASAFVDIDGSPVGMAIDLDMQATNAGLFACGTDSPVTPLVERRDSLPTPGLVHSPSSVRADHSSFSSASAGVVMSAQTCSSVGSTPSVPATPTNLAMLDFEPSVEPMMNRSSSQAKQHDCNEAVTMASQRLSSAFDFTAFPQALSQSTFTANVQSSGSCACSTSLTRASTTISPIPMPLHVAVPAPGWLDPEVLPNEMLYEPSGSLLAQHQQQNTAMFGDWSELVNTNTWTPPVTTATATRFEPYRNASIASTASSTSQSFFASSPALSAHRVSDAEVSGSRRRSLTVGSLSGLPWSLVDRVRLMGVSRPQTPSGQQASVPSSPRMGSTKKLSSMPCRRSRPNAPALSALFAQDSVEAASLKERRMASHASRAKVGGAQRSPLAGLFDAQDLLVGGSETAALGAEPSPTYSELSLGLCTPTSSTFSLPCTPGAQTAFDGESEEINADGTVVKAKIALHHHRTKLQRNVLNEVVTSLQGAYKHCRRQSSDPASLHDQALASELGQLQLQEHSDPLGLDSWMMADNEPTWSTSGVVVAGETKEMRKNRQKAESKMRMRRKEIAQFAALTTYAKLAYAHLGASAGAQENDLLGRSLAQVFMEHKEGWSTLVALEKRLFHTVRVKLGLQELVVKRLTEGLAELTA